jgi:hypothetical protein
MTRRLVVRAALVGLLAIALTAATAIGSTGISRGTKGGGFTLSGHVSGFLPGERRLLVITARNRGRTPLLVRSVVTHVHDPSAACSGGNLQVSKFRGRLRLDGRGSRRIVVTVSMSAASPSACQGAVFRLSFKGRATRG